MILEQLLASDKTQAHEDSLRFPSDWQKKQTNLKQEMVEWKTFNC